MFNVIETRTIIDIYFLCSLAVVYKFSLFIYFHNIQDIVIIVGFLSRDSSEGVNVLFDASHAGFGGSMIVSLL